METVESSRHPKSGKVGSIKIHADAIESWPLSRIKPNPDNPRKHSKDQISQIAESMREWGVTWPILVEEDGVIIAGHGRYAAAKRLKLKSYPVIVAQDWSEAQKRAYTIADNRLTELSDWDASQLAKDFASLQLTDFNLELTGFQDFAIDGYVRGIAQSDFDALAEWQGMPEFKAEDIQEGFASVKVRFRNAEDLARFAELMEQFVGEKTKSIWFPVMEDERTSHLEVVSHDASE